ncbi:MAG: hypothetical protein ACXWQO_18155 [Bdellovibrionota bacterium]
MRTFLFVLAFISTSAFAGKADLPFKDGDFGCFDQAKATKYFTDFNVDLDSFGGSELCNAAKDSKKLLNDLSLIEDSKFVASKDHMFIKGLVDRNTYYSWMKSQTRSVNRGHDIPFATAYNSWGNFTMQDGWTTLSTLGRVGTIIHEARHTAGYPHYRCTFGPYAASNVSGCDTSFAQGGAHAVEMEYYARVVLESQNLHPAYKSMARLMALGRANFVFNAQPMKKREALLGLAGDKLVLVDNNEIIERNVPAAANGSRLKRTSFGASLVKGQDGIAIDLYNKDRIDFAAKDDYSYYKLFQSPRDNMPTSVADTEELDVGSLRFFTVLDQQGKISSYDFPNGVWFPAAAGPANGKALITRAPNGQAGLFVVGSDGSIVPFDTSARRFGAPLNDRWRADTASFAMLNNTLVRLTSDGQVVNSATGTPMEGLSQYHFTDLVNVPMYDAFEVTR